MQVVASELVNIALSCRDFLAALPYCYKYLARDPKLQISLPGNRDWDALIRDPTPFVVSELLQILQQLKLPTKGDKNGKIVNLSLVFHLVELISRILGYFGLDQPRFVPARLAFYLKKERNAKVPQELYEKSTLLKQYGKLQTTISLTGNMRYVHWCKEVSKTYRNIKEFQAEVGPIQQAERSRRRSKKKQETRREKREREYYASRDESI